MSIDWDKEIECDAGEVIFLSCAGATSKVKCDDVFYGVDAKTGVVSSKWLHQDLNVRNKKTNRDKTLEVIMSMAFASPRELADALCKAEVIKEG